MAAEEAEAEAAEEQKQTAHIARGLTSQHPSITAATFLLLCSVCAHNSSSSHTYNVATRSSCTLLCGSAHSSRRQS